MSEQLLTIPLQETINAQFHEFARQTKEYIDNIRKNYDLNSSLPLYGSTFEQNANNVAQAIMYAQMYCEKLVDMDSTFIDVVSFGNDWNLLRYVEYGKLKRLNEVNGFKLFNGSRIHTVKMPDLVEITMPNVSCEILKDAYYLETLELNSLHSITGAMILCSNARLLTTLLLPALTNISSNLRALNNTQILSGLSSLTSLSLPAITNISCSTGDGIFWYNNTQILSGLFSLTSLSLPAITNISCSTIDNLNNTQILSELFSLTSLSLPAITNISCSTRSGANTAQILSGLSSLTSLSLPAITNINSVSSPSNNSNILSGCVQLEYVEIGHTTDGVGSITNNMRLNIDPTNTYEDTEKLAALNTSIREHWFANLRDYTGGTVHTLTLPIAFVQHMEQATKDVAAAKNWTLVTF